MKTTKIQCPARQRFRLSYDYARPFARHIGRSLAKWEHRIIYNLERARARGQPVRFLIVDRGKQDSRQLLIQYQDFITRDKEDGIIVAGRRSDTYRLIRAAKVRKSADKMRELRQTTFTTRNPDAIRGHSYLSALLLNVNRYQSILLRRILPIIPGAVPLTPEGSIIIHATSYRTREYPDPYYRVHLEWERDLRKIIAPIYTEPEAPPQVGIIDLTTVPTDLTVVLLGEEGPPLLLLPPRPTKAPPVKRRATR